MKIDLNRQAAESGAPLLPRTVDAGSPLGRSGLVVAGLLAAGLLLGSCSGGNEADVDAGEGGGQAEAGEGSAEQEAVELEAGSDTSFLGGSERLNTGVDLTQLNAGTSPVTSSPTNFDPIADRNAVPGHLTLGENQLQEFDFGQLHQGDVGSHNFILRSDGDAPLVITRLKPSCGCTIAEIVILGEEGERTVYRTGEAIPPNTSFEIVAELNTAGKSGAVNTTVAVYSNDPRAVFNLGLKAEVRPMLVVEPQTTIPFGQMTTEQSATNTVQVVSDVLDPFLLSLDERYIEDQPVQVELTPIEPNAEGRSTKWDVAVTVGPNLTREGINNFPVVLNTDVEVDNAQNPNPDGTPVYHQARVYAQVTVLSMVTANPPFISLGMLRPGERITNTVRITSMDEDYQLPSDPQVSLVGYRGTEFPYAEFFELELMPVEGENALDLDITLLGMPEAFTGSFGGIAKIQVGHPSKPEVEVRFSGLCRATIAGPTQVQLPDPVQSDEDHSGHDH